MKTPQVPALKGMTPLGLPEATIPSSVTSTLTAAEASAIARAYIVNERLVRAITRRHEQAANDLTAMTKSLLENADGHGWDYAIGWRSERVVEAQVTARHWAALLEHLSETDLLARVTAVIEVLREQLLDQDLHTSTSSGSNAVALWSFNAKRALLKDLVRLVEYVTTAA